MWPALYIYHSTLSSALSDMCTAGGGVRVVQQPEHLTLDEGAVEATYFFNKMGDFTGVDL